MHGKQWKYFGPQLKHFEEMGQGTDDKLTAIKYELSTFTTSIQSIQKEVTSPHAKVKTNIVTVASYDGKLQALEAKLADMEDRVCAKSITAWFSSIADKQFDIMRAHRIYNGNPNKDRDSSRTQIFNVLLYTDM